MAATPASAQRPSRHGRLSSSKKVDGSAPARQKSAVISPDADKQKDTHTSKSASTEVVVAEEDTKPELAIKKEEDSSAETSQQLSAQSSTDSQVQPRRSMTRTRKPSSRLMPSPSPPPSRSTSSSYHSRLASSTASLANATSNTGNGSSSTKAPQKKQTTATNTTTLSAQQDMFQTTVVATPAEQSQDKEFGPGKRKRRPSTMSKPPSTITKQAPPSTNPQQPAASTASAATGPSLKVRIIRVPSKSQTPEDKGHPTREKTAQSKKVKAESVVNQPPHTQPVAAGEEDVRSKAISGYDSDGDTEAARLMTLAEPEDQERDEESDAGQGSKMTRKIVIGRSKLSKVKTNGRRWPSSGLCSSSSAMHALEPPPLISRRGGLKQHAGPQHGLHKHQKPGFNDLGGHLRSQSTSVLDGKWAWTPSAIAPTLRFRLACHTNDDDSSEVSDMDDEDDFHVAMLDGGDFSEAHHRKAASLSSKDSHRDSKSGEDSDAEDTPATTPRSPQSTCELPERRWSTGADDEEKDSRKSARDSVFAHALEPSSHRPHTHAGALTLSLPFNEMSQGTEEDNSDGNSKHVTVAEEERDGGDGNGTAAVLMSPAVHHSILGISSKQHALLLSSPQANSAFTSPSLDATSSTPGEQSSRAEPAPLSLPSAAHSSATLASAEARERERIEAEYRNDDSSPLSGLHSSDEEEEAEMFTQTRLVLEPPESMCLSELDRAWEQSEYLYKARSMAGGRGEEVVDSAPDATEDGDGRTNKPAKRGGKRASLAMLDETKEEKETKKVKCPSKTQSVATPSPTRRSKRQSGTRV